MKIKLALFSNSSRITTSKANNLNNQVEQDDMNSLIKEIYEVAKSFVSGNEECSAEQFEDALAVIELVEEGEHEAAIKVGMLY